MAEDDQRRHDADKHLSKVVEWLYAVLLKLFTLRPLPCERAPPGLGLSCPQPDPNHPARWVRF